MTVNGHEVEARYRQALLDQQAVSKITLADGQSVEVKDIYVNRTLLHEVVQKQPEGEITVKLPVDLWPKLRDERVVLVEGPAGMGKSTLTKQLVRESETHHLIPIWIPFRQFVASGLTILEYLDQHYVPWLGLSDLRVPNRADETGRDHSLGQWCYDQWQSGLGLLILDGLDEVFRHEERVAALKALPITGTGRTRPATILTSRPLSQSFLLQKVTVDLQGLTPSDQRQFMEQYRMSLRLNEEQIGHFTRATTERGHSRFRELLTRPGHLIQILTTYAKTHTILDSETAVLNSLLESRLSITDRSEPPVEGDDAKKKRQVLLSLALHLLACRQGQRQTRAQLLALIQQVLWEYATHHAPLFPPAQATALLNDFVRNSGLLTEVASDVYEFETVIWLQHLTGAALANEQTHIALGLTGSDALDFLDRKAWDPEWEPVLKSWIGNGENPFLLFACLMDEAHDDLARHRLGVAGRCLHEVCPEQKSQLWYQRLATQIPQEAFVVWKANVKQDTADLVTMSLGNAWVETEVGQARVLGLLQSSHSMCETAAEILKGLGEAMPVSVQQALLARLADPDSRVSRAAVKALGGLGQAMPVSVQQALVAQLGGPDGGLCVEAAWALNELGRTMPVAVQQAFVARLEDSYCNVRETAAEVLKGLGEAMPVSVQQALLARLADPDDRVSWAAASSLGESGVAMSGEVQKALVAQLAGPVKDGRIEAAWALKQLGRTMPVAVQQALLARLADPDSHVRWAAALSLGELGVAMSGEVQKALVARLADSDSRVREAAGEALGELGVAMPISVQQALLALLAVPHHNVSLTAGAALGKSGVAMSGEVQKALVARLADPDIYVRWAAALSLGKLGVAMSGEVQKALVTRLADSSKYVRIQAFLAFIPLGTAMSDAAQQALIAQLASTDEDVRKYVVYVLEKLWSALPAVVQHAIVGWLADPDDSVRVTAGKALSSVQQQGLRFFLQGTVLREGRRVSELSSTDPLSDMCHEGNVHTPTHLALPVFSRLPLTAV